MNRSDASGSGVAMADPGSRRAAGWAWVWMAVLLVAVAALQQGAGSAAKKPAGAAGGGGGAGEIAAADDDPNVLPGKIAVRLRAVIPMAAGTPPEQDPLAPFGRMLRDAAKTPEGKVRAAAVLGEIEGAGAAGAMLDEVEKDLAAESVLRGDVAVLRALWAAARPGDDALKGFEERHGWFAKVAQMRSAADGAAARERLKSQGMRLAVVLVALGGVIALALVAGFGLFVTAVALAASGRLRWRHVMPAPGGSFGVEMAAVFFGAFLLLKGATLAVGHWAGREEAVWFSFLAQWLILGVVLWPRVRGVPWSVARRSLGWHSGEGVVREVLAGVVGYLACLPFVLGGAVLTLLAMLLRELVRQQMGWAEPPDGANPVMDLVSGVSGWQVPLLVGLAVVWAPVVEETVFRGGLFRQVGARMHWVPAALLTALVFALGHAYDVVLLFPVFALGVSFALIRQWRGSLIASMTGHFLHNAFVMTMALCVVNLVAE